MSVALEDFGGRKRYFRLQTAAGDWEVVRGADMGPSSGFGCFAWQIFWLRSRTIIGVFTDRQTLLLRIGPLLFDLKDPNVELRDVPTGLLLRRFSVLAGGQAVASVLYIPWAVDYESGFDGVGTMFDYLLTFRDHRHIDRTVFQWVSTLDGRDLETEEFEHELATRFPLSEG